MLFDPAVLERFLKRIEDSKIPVIAGILPLASYKTAEFFNNEVPGCTVPEPILNRLRHIDNAEAARAEGIRIAQETFERIQGMVQGIQIRGPLEDYKTAIEILSHKGIHA